VKSSLVLADSCVWIELFADGPNAARYALLLDGGVLVPPIVAAEVRRWFLRERGESDAARVCAALMSGIPVEATAAVGFLAADLGVAHQLAMADAFVLAHAHAASAELVTQDAHFLGLPGVRYVPRDGLPVT
jgi:predicted nucleic acid-binding protein